EEGQSRGVWPRNPLWMGENRGRVGNNGEKDQGMSGALSAKDERRSKDGASEM
ncbi:unnamed protein product, partial [Ectocarpus sp. 12 AP-2014]